MSPSDTCGSSLLVTQDRLTWVDLGAQLVEKGAAPNRTVGTVFLGAVADHSMPSLAEFTRQNGVLLEAFETALASFVGAIVEHTIVPSVGKLPIFDGKVRDADMDVRLFIASEECVG